jgi:Domain of unknown function (DUF4157)
MEEATVTALRPWFPDLDFSKVHIVTSGPAAWFVRTVLGSGATTIAPFIFFGKDKYDPSSPRSLALVAHELCHIQQYRKMGHVGFLVTYMRDRFKAGKYSAELPLERPAYDLQSQVLATLEQSGDRRDV